MSGIDEKIGSVYCPCWKKQSVSMLSKCFVIFDIKFDVIGYLRSEEYLSYIRRYHNNYTRKMLNIHPKFRYLPISDFLSSIAFFRCEVCNEFYMEDDRIYERNMSKVYTLTRRGKYDFDGSIVWD